MKPIILALFALIVAGTSAGLVGCGQKSALYLPGHNPNPPKPLMPAGEPSSRPASGAAGSQNTDAHSGDSSSAPPDTS